MLVLHPSSTCDVCLDRYSTDDSKIPLALPCGHTLCNQCCRSLQQRKCPWCRAHFREEQVKQLAVEKAENQTSGEADKLIRRDRHREDIVTHDHADGRTSDFPANRIHKRHYTPRPHFSAVDRDEYRAQHALHNNMSTNEVDDHRMDHTGLSGVMLVISTPRRLPVASSRYQAPSAGMPEITYRNPNRLRRPRDEHNINTSHARIPVSHTRAHHALAPMEMSTAFPRNLWDHDVRGIVDLASRMDTVFDHVFGSSTTPM